MSGFKRDDPFLTQYTRNEPPPLSHYPGLVDLGHGTIQYREERAYLNSAASASGESDVEDRRITGYYYHLKRPDNAKNFRSYKMIAKKGAADYETLKVIGGHRHETEGIYFVRGNAWHKPGAEQANVPIRQRPMSATAMRGRNFEVLGPCAYKIALLNPGIDSQRADPLAIYDDCIVLEMLASSTLADVKTAVTERFLPKVLAPDSISIMVSHRDSVLHDEAILGDLFSASFRRFRVRLTELDADVAAVSYSIGMPDDQVAACPATETTLGVECTRNTTVEELKRDIAAHFCPKAEADRLVLRLGASYTPLQDEAAVAQHAAGPAALALLGNESFFVTVTAVPNVAHFLKAPQTPLEPAAESISDCPNPTMESLSDNDLGTTTEMMTDQDGTSVSLSGAQYDGHQRDSLQLDNLVARSETLTANGDSLFLDGGQGATSDTANSTNNADPNLLENRSNDESSAAAAEAAKEEERRELALKKAPVRIAGMFDGSDIGKRVSVTGYASGGTLRWVGWCVPEGKEPTPRCGVELDLPLGRHDGSSKGIRYFKCAPGHGLITSVTKVSRGEWTPDKMVESSDEGGGDAHDGAELN